MSWQINPRPNALARTSTWWGRRSHLPQSAMNMLLYGRYNEEICEYRGYFIVAPVGYIERFIENRDVSSAISCDYPCWDLQFSVGVLNIMYAEKAAIIHNKKYNKWTNTDLFLRMSSFRELCHLYDNIISATIKNSMGQVCKWPVMQNRILTLENIYLFIIYFRFCSQSIKLIFFSVKICIFLSIFLPFIWK